ncbi:MAG: heme anaerobic degradation radical SAM methyltransferase ChuW/HutW, partial [Selenomonas sp.]|nr:heme anaerobic degradation radical SAM methyltransferase ChuW/HutW [Selenomonas sp.]
MSTLQEKINALPIEERAWLLGTKSENPLGCAFAKKRVVHPGAGGKRMVMDKEEQTRIWADLMAQTPNPADERAIYIHIPFCDKKCSYCGFFQNFTREEAAHHYVDVLLDELDAAADTPYVQGAPFQAVFFGGGTPTALSDADIARLVQAVRARLPLTSDCEITLEGRIHDLTESKVEAAMNAGINRFSLGVQSFDTRVRQAIGRIDDGETVIATLRRMVEQQGAVVIADLIYGLPYQSMEVWENDVRTQFEIGIAGGDLYQLNVFPSSELARRVASGDLPMLPTTEEQAEYFRRGIDIVMEYPMVRRIDTTHWATDHRERSIYNTLAKRGCDVLAFGSGAGGFIGQMMWRNHGALAPYEKLVEEVAKPFQFMGEQADAHRMQSEIGDQIEHGYLYAPFFTKKYGVDLLTEMEALLAAWAENGLVTRTETGFRLTRAGEFWHDNLIQGFLEAYALT